jgi:hypothetical protein
MVKITIEKAYVLGLLVGGGTISDTTFVVVLPFDKWGANPFNMSLLAKDVLTRLRDSFHSAYDVDINYELGNKGKWKIKPEGKFSIDPIVDDLCSLGLPSIGFLLDKADLTRAKTCLKGLFAEKFVTGIFDARGSLTESHRRFVGSSPVVSIEIPGRPMNFRFVVQLCSWLTELGSVTDQILYNHPCQHSPVDPEYSGWKKGFKIRFLANSFISKHSFALRAKVEGVTALAKRQNNTDQLPCEKRIPRANTLSIHNDVGSIDLPTEVRNKIFLHYHHLCAAMECPFAPYDAVRKMMPVAKDHISVFPLLSKGKFDEMRKRFSNLVAVHYSSGQILSYSDTCQNVRTKLSTDGYSDGDSGLAYLVTKSLNGKRHIGSKNTILETNKKVMLEVVQVDRLQGSPLFVGNRVNERGVLLSSPLGYANQQALINKIVVNGIDIDVR